MALIRTPRRIRANFAPDFPVEIDRNNHLGARVIEYLPLSGNGRALVSGNRITYGASGSTQIGPKGMTLRGAGASARASVPLNLSGHSKITIAFEMYWDAFANDDALAMELGANFVSAANGFMVDPNSGAPLTGTFTVGYGAAGVAAGHGFPRPSAGAWHHYVIGLDRSKAGSDATGAAMWIDNVSVVRSAGSGTTSPLGDFGNDTLYFFSRNNSALLSTGNLRGLTFLAGFPTDDTARELYRNPHQILKAANDAPLVPVSASAPGDVTGTVAVTNASDTSSAAGTTTVTGTLARTNANDTASASGSPVVAGTLARTNANDAAAASGAVGASVSGTLATTNANDTATASGAVVTNGTSATTNASDTGVASGTTTVKGSAATTNASDTAAASGSTTVKGASASTNASDTAAASGVTGTITGTSATTNANDTCVAGVASTGGAGDYGSSKKKRRRVIVNNKRYFVTDAELKRLLEAELLEPEPVKPVPKQAPKTPKAPDAEPEAEAIATSAPIKPLILPPVESIEQTVKFKRLMSSLQKQHDERAQAILRQIADEIEEEDIEFLLLMG